MKKLFLAIFAIAILFILFLLYNVSQFESSQLQVEPVEKIAIADGAVDRFAKAISIKTISYEDKADFDSSQFRLFNQFLIENYPLTDSLCEHQTINEFSHLYKWTGQDPSLAPVILMAHIDVVPIASFALWTAHPFDTGLKNDTIYGRGTMDDKLSLVGILEAVEQLMAEGFQPQRTIYLAFGHDEEVFGQDGAVAIADYLEEQGVEAAFVLDEGFALIKGLIPNLEQTVAMIGIAEKGFVSLELAVNMAGGHSSMPAKETAIDVLSKAVSNLKANPLEAKITPILEGFMDKLGPEMDFKSKLAFANRGIFKSLILGIYQQNSSGNATVRTTTSPTIFEAGIKENVIPTAARAVVNFRIIPGETVEDVIAHTRGVINDERVMIEVLNEGVNPSPISPIDNQAYETLERTIKEVYAGVATAPSLVVGGTDARHFTKISPNVYRFVPYQINPDNLNCFHGVDERMPRAAFEDAIRFYRQLVLNANAMAQAN